MRELWIIALMVFFAQVVFGQLPEKELMKKLKADKIEIDENNGDGVFKARNKQSKKWGMYQWTFEGVNVKELIPMEYDSVQYIPFNGAFTAVYKAGYVGFYLSAWSFVDARQTVPCLYEDYQRYTINQRTYLAVKKNGLWGWVDWLTGDEKSAFFFETKEELTTPNFEQKYN